MLRVASSRSPSARPSWLRLQARTCSPSSRATKGHSARPSVNGKERRKLVLFKAHFVLVCRADPEHVTRIQSLVARRKRINSCVVRPREIAYEPTGALNIELAMQRSNIGRANHNVAIPVSPDQDSLLNEENRFPSVDRAQLSKWRGHATVSTLNRERASWRRGLLSYCRPDEPPRPAVLAEPPLRKGWYPAGRGTILTTVHPCNTSRTVPKTCFSFAQRRNRIRWFGRLSLRQGC